MARQRPILIQWTPSCERAAVIAILYVAPRTPVADRWQGVGVVITNVLYRLDATRRAYISTAASLSAYAILLGVIVFSVICAIIGAWWMSRARRKQSEVRKAAIQARNQGKVVAWKRAVAWWERSWYCPRCGHVYISGESRSVPAKKMSILLYQ